MCRVAGIFDFKNILKEEIKKSVTSMCDFMIHGGPDDFGIYLNEEKDVALGHRRLSIIDVSELGHQPMSNKNKTIWITYNGEIYNFRELKEELIKHGYTFISKTDTEVLIYGYELWGIEKLLNKLRGMFAFAIYDENKNYLILARDRFGIKPLYYYRDNEKLIFSSEVKALMKSGLIENKRSEEALLKFLQLGSIPSPLTTVKNVFSLCAGEYMVVSKEKVFKERYWYLSKCFKNKITNKSITQLHEETKKLLSDSVNAHLISDVPLGVFLSGGIDSSALVALASKNVACKLKTLSVIFNDEEFSESEFSRIVAKKYDTDHSEFLLSDEDFFLEIPKILSAMDQPSIDGINTYFVSKFAKQSGLKVVLSGIGGDEVFLGYDYYKKLPIIKNALMFLQYVPHSGLKNFLKIFSALGLKKYMRLDYLQKNSSVSFYPIFRGLFSNSEITDLLDMDECELKKYDHDLKELNGHLPKDLIDLFNYLDFEHYLQDQILKDSDFMGMHHAIEIRVPYLDHLLVENVLGLKSDLKLAGKRNKQFLVNSLNGALPKEIWDRNKKGFTLPIGKWLNKNSAYSQELLLNSSFLDGKSKSKFWGEFVNNKLHWSKIWAQIIIENWKL